MNVYQDDDNLKGDKELFKEDDPFQGDEDEIRQRQKLHSVATISSLRVKPFCSSRFAIPLCRLLAMPVVRPTLSSDLFNP